MKIHLGRFKELITILAPAVLTAIPRGDKIAPFIPVITHAMTEAEELHGSDGAAKKAHVLAIVKDSVAVVNAAGHKTVDANEVASIASSGIDAVVKTVNLVHEAPETAPKG